MQEIPAYSVFVLPPLYSACFYQPAVKFSAFTQNLANH